MSVKPRNGDRPRKCATVRGPAGWLNWQAERQGQPARATSKTSGALLIPLWEEYALYSDATLGGQLSIGPYRLILTLADMPNTVGRPAMQVVLRANEHLGNPDVEEIDWSEEDVAGYYGGNLADEFAALLSLALGRRLRSGGVIRKAFDHDPLGTPWEGVHRPPMLAEPVHAPMLPKIADDATLEDAKALLTAYSILDGRRAVALVRSAQQYADALWWADADPRIAWIKLVSAMETAANEWSGSRYPDLAVQLERLHNSLYTKLESAAPHAIPIVAKHLKGTIGATAKFLDFTLAFLPNPPDIRPRDSAIDWSELEPVLRVIYDHRSRDLHDGIPFPAPLCEPPNSDAAGVPCEMFSANAAAGGGGVWPAGRMPIHLHVFAHIAGGALRGWWQQMASDTASAQHHDSWLS